jgi:NADPH:quinone reductase-like Zn-dependent oxidoreductase
VARGEGAEGPVEGTEVVINPALHWGDDPAVPGKEYRILGLPDEGTFAQFVKVPGDHVFPKPSHLSHEEAAAVPLAGLTAYRALVTRGQVQEGETVVIPGVGGGVATFLVQIAAALGARVFVTSGDEAKIEAANELGAEGGVNYNDENWSKELKGMAGGRDVSVDHVGRGGLRRARLARRARAGRIVSIGATRAAEKRGDAQDLPQAPHRARAPRWARRGVRRDARPLRRARAASGHQREPSRSKRRRPPWGSWKKARASARSSSTSGVARP